MKGNILEAVIGAVVLIIAGFFMFFAYTTSGEKINDGYSLVAYFDNVGGLVAGADVKINGIKIGIVKSLTIDENYQARAELRMKDSISVPVDTVASVTTDGLMGNKFVALSPGFDKTMLKNGEEIESTRSAVNLENLIDKFIVGSATKDKNANHK
jgi:phospholipid/cholesterol/gamma-HCH transport system substrate-binding protein